MSRHRGFKYVEHNGILAMVYDGAQEGTAVLAANTALTSQSTPILQGTPVMPALAVDSILLANSVASGDIALAVNRGGNSEAVLWSDASAGVTTLYNRGVEQLQLENGILVINEPGADVDLRAEGDNNANMIVLDAALDSLALGRAVVTGAFLSLDGATVNRAPVTSVGLELHLPAATYTKPAAASATTAIVARTFMGIPTFVASTNTATYTDAATLYIAGAAAASTNVTITRGYSLFVDAGTSRFDGAIEGDLATTSLTIQGALTQSTQRDIVIKTSNVADANGTTRLTLGSNAATAVATWASVTHTGIVLSGALDANTQNITGLNQLIARTDANMTIDSPAGAFQLAIRGLRPAASAGDAIVVNTYNASDTLTTRLALSSGVTTAVATWANITHTGFQVTSGSSIDGSAGAFDIVAKAATTAAMEITDGTTKLLAFDTRTTVDGTVQTTLTPLAKTVAEATSGHISLQVSAVTHILSRTSPSNVITSASGIQVRVNAATLNATSNATTITTASTMYIESLAVGANMTVTNSRIIDTDVTAFLTKAGVWTDNCGRVSKTEIEVPGPFEAYALLDEVESVSYKRWGEGGHDGPRRFGVIAEDVPDFLADSSRQGVAAQYIAGFNLAVQKDMKTKIDALEGTVAKLEKQLKGRRN